MINFARGFAAYATICTILALSLLVGLGAYGSTFHGAMPPPDDGTGNITTAHGAMPPPDDGTGNILMAHGAMPPPDDGTGNIIA
jgi:hypothetical protein